MAYYQTLIRNAMLKSVNVFGGVSKSDVPPCLSRIIKQANGSVEYVRDTGTRRRMDLSDPKFPMYYYPWAWLGLSPEYNERMRIHHANVGGILQQGGWRLSSAPGLSQPASQVRNKETHTAASKK